MTAHGSSGMTLEMKVTNDSRRRLTVKRAKLTLFIDRRTVGHIYLHEPFRFERHSSGRVSSLWRMSFPDNMQLYALKRRILRDDTSQIFVSYDAVVRCGLVKANISGSYVSLSEFLNTFGMDTEILKQYLEW